MVDLEPDVQTQLSSPPFVTVEGVSNVRSLGNYPSSSQPNQFTRASFMYRSGEISAITPTGKDKLKALGFGLAGIKKIFDLRSDIELEKFGAPIPELTDEIQIIRIPVFKNEDYSPEMIARRYQLYASGKVEAFMHLYSQILDHAILSYGTIFKHVRDRPDEGFLFHCTAGKDRTGVLAALLLKLAGVDNDLIAEDYSLTRIGRVPQRALIMSRLSKEPLFAENNEAVLKMLDSKAETMVAFLALLEENYGGVESYMEKYLGFSAGDVAVIRKNLLFGPKL